MDQKGSLVDTNLRIYPSEALHKFLKSMPIPDETPENLQIFLGKSIENKTTLNKDNKKSVSVDLTKQDIKLLEKIKNEMGVKNIHETVDGDAFKSNEKENVKLSENQAINQRENSDSAESKLKSHDDISIENEEPYLITSDIDWLYLHLQKRRSNEDSIPYLHELFTGSKVEMPKNEVLKRNPVLEARCVKLRAQQEAREYRQMTKGVDNVRMKFPEDSIAYQMKQINRQLIAILQFIISIFAGFLFGFQGLEWMIGNLDFGFRLLMGVMCALVIALAEIYFLAKKLNEELSMPETVQLGGPPKFVDESLNPPPKHKMSVGDKQHQD